MEDLNKTQIILMCLLLSFVTSIATGIITTSLLSEAPPAVTQTINRVVEQTIQQVVPATGGGKEVRTVVVSVDDQVVESISKSSKSIVRIQVAPAADATRSFFSVGVVVSSDGTIITGLDGYNSASRYWATFSDGSVYPLGLVIKDDSKELLIFRAERGNNDKYVFSPTVLSSDDAKLGQTLIFISGQSRNNVVIAHVSDVVKADPSSTSSPITLVKLDTPPKDPIVGLPLLDLSGGLIGLRSSVTFNADTEGFIPVNVLKELISKIPKL